MSAGLCLAELDRAEIERRIDVLFSFDHGPEYPHEDPPGHAAFLHPGAAHEEGEFATEDALEAFHKEGPG